MGKGIGKFWELYTYLTQAQMYRFPVASEGPLCDCPGCRFHGRPHAGTPAATGRVWVCPPRHSPAQTASGFVFRPWRGLFDPEPTAFRKQTMPMPTIGRALECLRR